jgi:ferredoxin
MAKTPYVDQEACICCNLCADTVPDVFRMNDAGVAEVFDPRGASEEVIQEAMDACPVACVHWQG